MQRLTRDSYTGETTGIASRFQQHIRIQSGCRVDASHERNHQPAQARSAFAAQPDGLSKKHRRLVSTRQRRRFALCNAALSRTRFDGFHAEHVSDGRNRSRHPAVQRIELLVYGKRAQGELVLGRSYNSSNAARAREARHAAVGCGTFEVYSLVQRGPRAADDGGDGRALWSAGLRSLWNDRSIPPDGLKPAAAE